MKVIIMRGIPGSGKTTEARRWASLVPGAIIVSTDDYMFAGGQAFDPGRLEFCHKQCFTDYMQALNDKTPLVILDNTNTKFSDVIPYIQEAESRGYEFTVMQLHIDPEEALKRGTHEVPRETLELLATRIWSNRLPSTWDVWNKGQPWRPTNLAKREEALKNEPEVIRASR